MSVHYTASYFLSWGACGGCECMHTPMQASLATVHNLWIATAIGAVLAAFLWCNAPLLIQGGALSFLCGC